MKLSIITLTRDNPEDRQRTIQSLSALTFAGIDFEHLIIDSSAVPAAPVPGVRWVREENLGIYSAMNRGIQEASGELIWFLHSGDMLAQPEVVAEIIQAFEQDSKLALWIGAADLVRKGGYLFTQYPGKSLRTTLRTGRMVCQQAMVYRRDVFRRWGTFDLKFSQASDYEFLWRLIGSRTACSMKRWVRFDADGCSNRSGRALRERVQIGLGSGLAKLSIGENLSFLSFHLGGWTVQGLIAALKSYDCLDGLRAYWIKWRRLTVRPV